MFKIGEIVTTTCECCFGKVGMIVATRVDKYGDNSANVRLFGRDFFEYPDGLHYAQSDIVNFTDNKLLGILYNV